MCSGYLASFKDLQVTSVVLEHVVQSPDKGQKDSVVNNDTARLRELAGSKCPSTKRRVLFVDANPILRLWRHLAEAALEALDLQCADKAVKMLRLPGHPVRQKTTSVVGPHEKKSGSCRLLRKVRGGRQIYNGATERTWPLISERDWATGSASPSW